MLHLQGDFVNYFPENLPRWPGGKKVGAQELSFQLEKGADAVHQKKKKSSQQKRG